MSQGKFRYTDWISKRSLRLKFFNAEVDCMLTPKMDLIKKTIWPRGGGGLEAFAADQRARNLTT